MSFLARLIGILLCALAQGVWLGASAHALVHNHAHSHDNGAEIETVAGAPSDCPACQLSLAAPDVPTVYELSSALPLLPSSATLLLYDFLAVPVWPLPFGHAPPFA